MKALMVLVSVLLGIAIHARGAEMCSNIFEPAVVNAEDLIKLSQGPRPSDLKAYIAGKLEASERTEFQSWWNSYEKNSSYLNRKWKLKPAKTEEELNQQAIYLMRLISIQSLRVQWSTKLRMIYKDPLRLHQAEALLERLTTWEEPLRDADLAMTSLPRRGLRIAKSALYQTTKDWILDPNITASNFHKMKPEAAVATMFRYYRNVNSAILTTVFSVVAYQLLDEYIQASGPSEREKEIKSAEELLNRDVESIKTDINQKMAEIDQRKLTPEQKVFLDLVQDRLKSANSR